MGRTIILTILPAIFILLLSILGYTIKNAERILRKKRIRRTDDMVFGHYWMIFSFTNLFFLCRLFDEHKFKIPYISTSYITLFFSVSTCSLLIIWVFSIFYLMVLAKKQQVLRRRHIINLLGVFSIFALSWALSGV